MIHEKETTVSIRDLEKRFGAFVAVNRISLEVGKGEIFGFLGPNGAGKSTTIRMLCGILRPDDGAGTVAGFDIFSQSEEIKKHIGYMSQKFSLYEDLTVEENLDFYAGIYRIPTHIRSERKEWAIRMSGLATHRHSLTRVLSGGWRQKLSLGCAVMHEPPVLFLDEPTSGVDPISRRQFWDLIYELAEKGVTVFVTTHYMDEAEYCDRIALIYRGEMISLGTPADLKNRMRERALFEISGGDQNSAVSFFQNRIGIIDLTVFGNTLHVSAVSDDAAACAFGLWQRSGFPEARMERILPTLEDVFVSSIEEYDQTHAPVAGVQL